MQNIPNGTYQTCTLVVKKNIVSAIYSATASVKASPNIDLKPGDKTTITFRVKNTGPEL